LGNNDEITRQLAAIRAGDKTAFEALYHTMQTPMYTIIYRITWDKAASEDILQEVFVKLYRSPPNASVRRPRSYLFQMARNLAIDYTRKPRDIPLETVEIEARQSSDNTVNRLDMESALKSLPAQDCQIVTLHIIADLTFREIAALMDIPLGTALWRYQRALGKLRKELEGGSL